MKGAWVLVGGAVAANAVVIAALLALGSGPAPQAWTVAEAGTVPSSATSSTEPPEPIGPPQLAANLGPAPLRAAPDWIERVSGATGVSAVAIRAYGAATLTLARDRPACGLGWSTLAAIGAVESGQGTHGGGTLLEDGHPSIPVIGPALNGTHGTAAISAGDDDAAWHGDQVWAHAVGPMQFLPSTWRTWSSDGDGDGTSDPNDLDDAALAAGRYLCASGADLTTGTGWHAAVVSYNHDEAYVALVLATANGFAGQS